MRTVVGYLISVWQAVFEGIYFIYNVYIPQLHRKKKQSSLQGDPGKGQKKIATV